MVAVKYTITISIFLCRWRVEIRASKFVHPWMDIGDSGVILNVGYCLLNKYSSHGVVYSGQNPWENICIACSQTFKESFHLRILFLKFI